MPSIAEKNEIYRELFLRDSYGRTKLNNFTAKLSAIFMSKEFKEAMGVTTVEKKTRRGEAVKNKELNKAQTKKT